MIQLRNLEEWSEETKAAYVACALDTDGWIGLGFSGKRDGTKRLSCSVGVTNQNIDLLKRIATICEVPFNLGLNDRVGKDYRGIKTTKPCFQVMWGSPIHVIPIIEKALPYIISKREQGNIVLEFAKSRITPKGKVYRRQKPYTSTDFELVMKCKILNNRKPKEDTAP